MIHRLRSTDYPRGICFAFHGAGADYEDYDKRFNHREMRDVFSFHLIYLAELDPEGVRIIRQAHDRKGRGQRTEVGSRRTEIRR